MILAGPPIEYELRLVALKAAQLIAKRTGHSLTLAPGVVVAPSGNVVHYCICPDPEETGNDVDDPACPVHGVNHG